MTTAPDTLSGDAAIWRRVVEQMVEDCQQIAFWAASARGTSMVTRWQSAELRERAMLARSRAQQLRQINARLRASSADLHGQRARNDSSSSSANRPTSCPQVVAIR